MDAFESDQRFHKQIPTVDTTRLPLGPAEKNNAATTTATRRPRTREVGSRYKSPTPSRPSSSPRRCPSPNLIRTAPSSASQLVPKRSLSAERKRPSTPPSPTTPVRETSIDSRRLSTGRLPPESLWPSTMRSLSVSFQSDSISIPVSKKERPVSSSSHYSSMDRSLRPSSNVTLKPSESSAVPRKPTPERKRSPLNGRNDQTENAKPISRLIDQHRWPSRIGGKMNSNSLNKSLDLLDKPSRNLSATLRNVPSDVNGIKPLQKSGSCELDRLEFDDSSLRGGAHRPLISASSLDRTALANAAASLDRTTLVNAAASLDRTTLVNAAASVRSASSLPSSVGSRPASPSNRTAVGSHPASPRTAAVSRPASPSSRTVAVSRPASPSCRSAVVSRPASPSSRSTSSVSRGVSPSRGRPSTPPPRGVSPSRIRSSSTCTQSTTNATSVLSFVADVKKGKKGAEDAHQLRLLHNRCLQWRFANAQAEAVMDIEKLTAEENLYNVWNAMLSLWDSVVSKRIILQQMELELKLNSILNDQIPYFDDWELLERNHASSLAGAVEDLQATTLRLPVTGGARADIESLEASISSALDVMQGIGLSICALLSKVEGMVSLVSDLAVVAAREKTMLDECENLLATTAEMQVEEYSLWSHLIQMKPKPTIEASIIPVQRFPWP